ncbi:MAG: M20/M25/M40 family metallo-hydrolase, partial [Candidatus Ancillula sp.]|nr:M20/M25/M40 family metallo-hydrolase [Candidatus Ancillula sp.]
MVNSIKDVDNFENVVDEVFGSAVETLKDLVRIPSISNVKSEENAKNVQKSAEFVLKTFEAEGIKGRIASAPKEGAYAGEEGNPAIIGFKGAGKNGELDPNKPTVLLYSHHDVQPVQNPEKWIHNKDAFEPVVLEAKDGLRMFGRGAADDGAGLAAHVGVLRLYKALGKDLPVNLKIYFEGEEEAGSPSFANFIEKYQDELKADVIIVADSDNWTPEIPAITSTLRGVCTIELELAVLDHSIHSGTASGPIIDANALMMKTISSIWGDDGQIVVEGLLGAKGSPVEDPKVDIDEKQFRIDNGILDGVELVGEGSITGRVWNKPSVTVIGF